MKQVKHKSTPFFPVCSEGFWRRDS